MFITGGEKDVLSLVSHGFNAICLNSETAQLPKNLLRSLGYRFRHITLLYDVDETGLQAMEKQLKENKEVGLKALILPLPGHKTAKDISDFFRVGNGAEDLMILFREMLDEYYKDTIAVMRTCVINFDNPPPAPDPLLSINGVTIGSPGNLVCVSGSEGSGKTNYLGGLLSGSIKPNGLEIDTLGTTIRENVHDHSVLLYDTEQSEYQLYKNLTYILKRSGLERPPECFKAYSLVSISRIERMQLILESMDKHYYESGGIHLYLGEVDKDAAQANRMNDLREMANEAFKGKAMINNLELRQLLQNTFGVQDRTARSYVKRMLEAKIIEKSTQFPSNFRLIET